MSTAPGYGPRLLTVAEYVALGETELGYDELVEGRVVLSPTPDAHRAHALLAAMLPCHLGGELGYVDGGAVTGVFSTTEPFPVRLDLGGLG